MRYTAQLSLAIRVLWDLGRCSEPHAPVPAFLTACSDAETKSGLSLLLLPIPFSASMGEGEKCLLLLPAGSSNEGGSGSRVYVSIQQSF